MLSTQDSVLSPPARTLPAGAAVWCPVPSQAATAVPVPQLGLLPSPLVSPAQNPPLPFPRHPSQAAQGDFTVLIPGNR